MALEQIRFLGSSITSFSANLGWGTQESRLQVGLVDDVRNGDGFNPPDVGTPVYFDYQGWQFNGLLEHYGRDRGPAGNPVYSISVVDPRVLLDGIQIIISDYYGITVIPNVINAFGYMEFLYGFGGSQKNESGMPYLLVQQAIHDLTDEANIYGGPISYKGFSYNIDLSALPLLPANYRISASPSMSIMEFVNEICDAGASEYFFTLQGRTIVLNTISRANIPLKGVINQFVSSVNGCVSTSAGLDMVNETCSKFLIGGAVTDVFYNFYSTGDDGSLLQSSNDNPIWYYWGTDNDGNLITSDDINQAFRLDSRSVLVNGVGDSYPTDIGEMRAALSSQDSWETYLWMNCFNAFVFDADGTRTDSIYFVDSRNNFIKNDTITYKHNGVENPHFRKAFDLGVNATMDFNIVSYLLGQPAEVIIGANIRELSESARYAKLGISENHVDTMTKLYGLIQSYASEYYGRKFMVMLPDVYVKQDSETLDLSYSHDTCEGGYLTEDAIENAVNNNLMPLDTSTITLPDGRVSAYVRFDNIERLDMKRIQPEDLLFGKNLIKNSTGSGYSGTNSIFVRCTVEDSYVFLDNVNFTSPRAVITLTSPVYVAGDRDYADLIIFDFLNRATAASTSQPLTRVQIDSVMQKFLNCAYGDLFNGQAYPIPVIPNMAAIPVRSNLLTYGPWYSASANGKTEVEHAEDLVPWNYNGYTNMNLAANARTILATANLQWVESGAVEFPGTPDVSLGSQLLTSGPYITDIRVSVGQDGVKTSYSMRSWNPQFGKAAKYTLDKIGKLTKLNQQLKKNTNEKIRLGSFKNQYLGLKGQLPNIQ